jgi:hypothetical protein
MHPAAIGVRQYRTLQHGNAGAPITALITFERVPFRDEHRDAQALSSGSLHGSAPWPSSRNRTHPATVAGRFCVQPQSQELLP